MTVSFNQNYFQLFEIEQSVFIDFNILEEKYLELQKEFHPDKYVNASEQEKRLSIQITSYINEAYNTLKNDYLKSVYLLKIEGYEFEDQNNTISDTEFLMHQMELREEYEKITLSKNSEELKNFAIKIERLKNECLLSFNRRYEKKMYNDASIKIKEMKFYISIENDFKKDNY
jgi:molecular chaperone HscB